MSLVEQSRVTEAEISALVEAFYARVQDDAVIGPIFNEQVDDWPAHLKLLKSFWAAVLMGIGQFKGNPLETHLKLKLEAEHFARWLALFAETARDMLPQKKADVFIEKSQRIAKTFQRGIAARQGGLGILAARG